MTIFSTLEYKRAFGSISAAVSPIELSLKAELKETRDHHATTHYIWRTVGDGRVRASHAANEGRIFSWDDPPETGHPGEDYNCRCTAEPYVQGESEFAYQDLVSDITSRNLPWDAIDFTMHFFSRDGGAIDLQEIGNLPDLIEYYYDIIIDGKNTVERLKAQIIDEARKNPAGTFTYFFNEKYNFKNYIYVFGDATVKGQFQGTVRYENSIAVIDGKIDFLFKDEFTDPVDVRQLLYGSSKPRDSSIGTGAELGGIKYDITGAWQTRFRAEAKTDRNNSIYQWKE